MEINRRRPRRYGFDALSAEQQVAYVIENWDNEIWTPVNEETLVSLPLLYFF